MELKTNKEIYQEYMYGIEDLENKLSTLQWKKERENKAMDREIERTQERIEALKATADSYTNKNIEVNEPFTINIQIENVENVKGIADQLMKSLTTKGIQR